MAAEQGLAVDEGEFRRLMTTVRQPLSDMAREAARLLVERIEHDGDIGPGRERLFATSLVRRSTTRQVGG